MKRVLSSGLFLLALVASCHAQTFPGQLPAWNIFANPSAAEANGKSATITQMLDGAFCSTTNAVLQRSGSAWVCQTLAIPITVANGGTGLASGTSGGIPYFSSTSTMASSAALGANSIVLGGGAGGAPLTANCAILSASSIQCTDTVNGLPGVLLFNQAADASSSLLFFDKSRASANTQSGDLLGEIIGRGWAGGSRQNSLLIAGSQTAASSGNNIPSKWTFSTSNAAGQINQSLTFDSGAHLSAIQATAPVAATCTGFAFVSGGDLGGKLTMTSGTTCSITFGTAFAAAPACVVSPGSAASTHFATTNTTTLSVTFGTAQTAWSWVCVGA